MFQPNAIVTVLLIAFLSACGSMSQPHTVQFTEPESFTLSDEFAKPLGYRTLTVAAGTYTVHFDTARPYGYVELILAAAEPDVQSKAPGDGFGLRIRIARRDRGCQSGLGFRCGLVPHLDAGALAAYAVHMQVSGNILEIDFREAVPFQAGPNVTP